MVGFVGLAGLGPDETAPPDAVQIEDGESSERAAEGDTSGRTSQTFPKPTAAPTTSAPSVELDQLDPAGFDQPTGYDLVMGGSRPLLRLSLDSGMVERYETQGNPVGVVGNHLLIENNGQFASNWLTVPLDDLGAEPFVLLPIGGDVSTVISATTGDLWFVPWSIGDGVAQRIDPGSGELLEEVGVDGRNVEYFSGPFGGLVASLDFVTARTGGIYRFGDDGYERLMDGRMVSRGVRLALIETCDDQLQCSVFWFDLETEQKVDHPLPPESDGIGGIQGDDRWLLLFSGGPTWQLQLVEIATGRIVDDLGSSSEPLSISPDGRLLATNEGVSLVVIDLDTGERAEFPRSALIGFDWSPALFVPSASAVQSASIEPTR